MHQVLTTLSRELGFFAIYNNIIPDLTNELWIVVPGEKPGNHRSPRTSDPRRGSMTKFYRCAGCRYQWTQNDSMVRSKKINVLGYTTRQTQTIEQMAKHKRYLYFFAYRMLHTFVF